MADQIYTSAREKVKARDQGRCCRCQMQAFQWHHRRRRREKDEHTDRPCNGLLLCVTCHQWITEHPLEARPMGWIVLSHQNPEEVPVFRFRMWCYLLHDGGVIPADDPNGA